MAGYTVFLYRVTKDTVDDSSQLAPCKSFEAWESDSWCHPSRVTSLHFPLKATPRQPIPYPLVRYHAPARATKPSTTHATLIHILPHHTTYSITPHDTYTTPPLPHQHITLTPRLSTPSLKVGRMNPTPPTPSIIHETRMKSKNSLVCLLSEGLCRRGEGRGGREKSRC